MVNEGQKPIRVLFVNTRNGLGADVAVHLTLIKSFGALCEVSIATNSRSVDLERILAQLQGVPGLRIDVLNLGYVLSGLDKFGKLASAAGNAVALLMALPRLAIIVWSRRIEVIHSTDRPRDALLSTLLARLTRRKNVLHLHIKWDQHMGRATTWAVRRCDAVLAISDFVRRSLIERGVPENKIFTALNATDPCEFDPDRHAPGMLRTRLELNADTRLVGIVGRIMFWKGHLDLIEAFALVKQAVPNAVLAIVGREDNLNVEGVELSYAGQVRNRISELSLDESVLWAGWFDETAPIFADIDVACVPSWEEPFGLVVTEAMSMQCPVVGYTSGALPEIIANGEEGLLVPPKDIPALADAIIGLLKDPENRRKMGRKGRERVLKQFTPQRQAEEVAEIYRRICRP